MPLELGIDLGCKAFNADCHDKSLLIFDSELDLAELTFPDFSYTVAKWLASHG